jgi:hypothetical protein
MVEILSGGLLGSIFGGVFRLAPEFLKFMDRKNERMHELKMFELQTDLEKVRGAQKLDEIGAQREMAIDTGVLGAFQGVINQQTEMVKAAGKGWVTSLSASVRPVITYALIAVYLGMQLAMGITALNTEGVKAAFDVVMTPDFAALVGGIINYYFMNRTLERRGM